MNLAIAALALIELVLLGFALAQRRGTARFQKRRVVIHTRDEPDGRSIRGVLTGVYADCLVLSSPEYLGEATPAELPGHVLVLRANVSWMQVL